MAITIAACGLGALLISELFRDRGPVELALETVP
jgi:hypothetical protein